MRLPLAVLTVALCACAGNRPAALQVPEPTLAARTFADTLFGRVYVSAESPEGRIMGLQTRDGQHFTLGGPTTVTMRVLGDVGTIVEAWIGGTREGGTFFVDAFEVRAVAGQPVDDGWVTVAGSRVTLVAGDGRRIDVRDPPAPLRYLPGSRVWVLRNVPRTLQTPYGIIVRR